MGIILNVIIITVGVLIRIFCLQLLSILYLDVKVDHKIRNDKNLCFNIKGTNYTY